MNKIKEKVKVGCDNKKYNDNLCITYFEASDAVKYGINEATILSLLKLSLDKNTKNISKKVFFYDGAYWSNYSVMDMSKFLPWISPAVIRRALIKLEKMGAIRSANLNKNKYDRSKWYTIN